MKAYFFGNVYFCILDHVNNIRELYENRHHDSSNRVASVIVNDIASNLKINM